MNKKTMVFVIVGTVSVFNFFLFQNMTSNQVVCPSGSGPHIFDVDKELEQTPKNAEYADGLGIQSAINKCLQYSHETGKKCTLRFGKNKTYYLNKTKAVSNHYGGLVISGSNAHIYGCGSTIINKARMTSYWGDTIDIAGFIPGTLYPRYNESKDSSVDYMAENIVIQDLILKEEGYAVSKKPPMGEDASYSAKSLKLVKSRNCMGIAHAKNITIKNISCIDAPQSSFAIVSSFPRFNTTGFVKTKNINIVLDGVLAKNSGQHAFRFLMMEGATHLSATLKNSSSTNIIEKENRFRLADGVKAHLIYSASMCNKSNKNSAIVCGDLEKQPTINDGNVSLKLENNFFDKTANVIAVRGVGKLEILNNKIEGGLVVKHLSNPNAGKPILKLVNNTFSCESSAIAAKDVAIVLQSRASQLNPIGIVGVDEGEISGNKKNNSQFGSLTASDSCFLKGYSKMIPR